MAVNQLLNRNWNGNGMEWNGIDFGSFDGFYILTTCLFSWDGFLFISFWLMLNIILFFWWLVDMVGEY